MLFLTGKIAFVEVKEAWGSKRAHVCGGRG